ncbi:MAG: 50S ribosomal protein L19e [archaeon]
MNDRKAKRMAAVILKVGKTKIWVNPEEKARLKEAMTKEDIRQLIKENIIKKRRGNLHSRGKARLLAKKKSKGRKRGKGKRKGGKAVRVNKKEKWVKNVRAQRQYLKELKASGAKLSRTPREIYLMIKGGFFKGKKYMQAMVEEAKK